MASDDVGRQYLTRKEAAEYVTQRWFPCSVFWLSKLGSNGAGPKVRGEPAKLRSRKYYLKSELDDWAQERLSPMLDVSTSARSSPEKRPE